MKMPASETAPPANRGQSCFSAALGALLGIALLKFGNPVILEDRIEAPTNISEWWYGAWPLQWAPALLALVGLLVLPVFRSPAERPRRFWLGWLPLAWLGWQILSAIRSIDPAVTRSTWIHFIGVVACFYLGLHGLGRIRDLRLFWLGLLAGFGVVLICGVGQHFGGLEETRRFFYSLPNWREYPPAFLKKIQSDRIYSTLFYPNALAGVILLLLPVWILGARSLGRNYGVTAGRFAAAIAGALGAACLVWSGSKTGWLIALAMALVAIICSPLARQFKAGAIILVAVLGLAGFAFRHSAYLARGATSASARLDYWKVAARLSAERPLLGSGPGTFYHGYKRLKPPEAEMTRLVHNDYLQQASDSGVPGALAYFIWILGSVWCLRPSRRRPKTSLQIAVWLGIAALSVQSAMEFGLYIPAISWPWLTLTGWLWSVDNNESSESSVNSVDGQSAK